MLISDSELFKGFARPILKNHGRFRRETDNSDSDIGEDDAASQLGIMDSIVQYIAGRARLEVSLIKFTNATENSFAITMESRVTGTGPISHTVSAMEIKAKFNNVSFGKICLPEIKTSMWGANVAVQNQTVQIHDKTAFNSFLRSIMTCDDTSLQLRHGACTIRGFGMAAEYYYRTDVGIEGMRGPIVRLKRVERGQDGIGIVVTATVHNPSPVEMDCGVGLFNLRNVDGELIARLKGRVVVARGDSEMTLRGQAEAGATATVQARFLGAGAEGGASWASEAIRHFDVIVDISDAMAAVLFPKTMYVKD